MVQDDLYSRFAEHVETFYLAVQRQNAKLCNDIQDRPGSASLHEGSALLSGRPGPLRSNTRAISNDVRLGVVVT
jgi:hypothetical protein